MPNQTPFPSKDIELNGYFEEAVPLLLKDSKRLNVSTIHQDTVSVLHEVWNGIFPLSQSKNSKTPTVIENKDIAKENLKAEMRLIFADIPQSALTIEDRNVLNIAAPSTSKTPAPVPVTRPVGQVNTSNRWEHEITCSNESGGHGKPKGVRGCQIWSKEDTPITNFDELTFVATVSKSPYIHRFPVSKSGKLMYYLLRWENTRGEVGPWSTAVSATVTG
ncbi:hypothetical protein [Flavobacterium sp. SM2513]|uniref:hypothetical protein n=1 Tax=Flavobacterium sp. SM2513 TaxID=3424766 RepID=UPI003D7F2AE2